MSDDKVHPSSKPTTNPSKPRPSTLFRPQHNRNRNRDHNICCSLCCYLFLLLFFLLVLVAIAVTVFYLLFHPQPPSFTLTSLTTSSSSSSFDLTLSATNPNSKITFSYQPASVSILAGDTSVAGGIVPAFEQRERNTTVLVASIESSGTTTTTELRNDAALGVKVKIVTKVEAKVMGALKTPRVGITVLCDGVSVSVPATAGNKKTAAVAEEPTAAEPMAAVEEDPTAEVAAEPTAAVETVKTSGCKVDVRFKVWKWIV